MRKCDQVRLFNSRRPSFSPAQVRGILWLLPLLGVVVVILVFANRPRFEKSFLEQAAEQEGETRDGEVTDSVRVVYVYQDAPQRRMPRNTAARDTSYRQRREYPKRDTVRYDGHKRPVKVSINTADSATLRTVSGIGEYLVTRIIDYRTRLGGYVQKEQLLEIPGMYPENFERIVPQIFIDSAGIQKIDINFASPDRIGKHPYVDGATLRKLLKYRQLKGGWRTTQELIEQDILTPQRAEKLAPYLIFN